MGVKSATYDPANDTVTLRPGERINIHHRYTLVVDGTAPGGVTNTQGLLLDGPGRGHADGDYRASAHLAQSGPHRAGRGTEVAATDQGCGKGRAGNSRPAALGRNSVSE